jgi:hypothetical protein
MGRAASALPSSDELAMPAVRNIAFASEPMWQFDNITLGPNSAHAIGSAVLDLLAGRSADVGEVAMSHVTGAARALLRDQKHLKTFPDFEARVRRIAEATELKAIRRVLKEDLDLVMWMFDVPVNPPMAPEWRATEERPATRFDEILQMVNVSDQKGHGYFAVNFILVAALDKLRLPDQWDRFEDLVKDPAAWRLTLDEEDLWRDRVYKEEEDDWVL